MSEEKPSFDVHCKYCKQVIIPSDRMSPLHEWLDGRNSGELFLPDLGTALVLSMKVMCKGCGRFVWFDMGEQKLDLLLRNILK